MNDDTTFLAEELNLLHAWRTLLEKEGLPCTVRQVEGLEGLPVNALYLPLNADDPATDFLEMRAQRQVAPQEDMALVALQFLVYFSQPIRASAIIDMALFVTTVNRHLPLPGFELDMGTHRLYYRYVLYNSVASIDAVVLKSLVGAIIYSIEMYKQPIHSLALGQKSYYDMMEEVAAAVNATTPPDQSAAQSEPPQ